MLGLSPLHRAPPHSSLILLGPSLVSPITHSCPFLPSTSPLDPRPQVKEL